MVMRSSRDPAYRTSTVPLDARAGGQRAEDPGAQGEDEAGAEPRA